MARLLRSRQEARSQVTGQAQHAAAVHTPELLPVLLQRQELLSHFVSYYTQLHALPRRMRRLLQRRLKQSLVGIALLLALGQGPTLAATIRVTTSTPRIVANGQCSLLEALENANDNTDGRVHEDCRAGTPGAGAAGADTIVLPKGSIHALPAVHNTVYGATGLPVVTSVVTLQGRGSVITRHGSAPDFRIVAVGSTGVLTLTETTVHRGVAGDEAFPGNAGGGVANFEGTVTLINSTITGNRINAGAGAGLWNSGIVTMHNSTIRDNGNNDDFGKGGGVWNSGTITMRDSTITGNRLGNGDRAAGGGVWNSGTVTIHNGTIARNIIHDYGSDSRGGGVWNSGTVTMRNNTVSGNKAGDYGSGNGVWNSGTVTIRNSTIARNRNRFTGGDYKGDGGGVWNSGLVTIRNSTVSDNVGDGGGVWNSGTVTMHNSTVSGNFGYGGGGVRNSGTVTMHNSTVSGNYAGYDGGGGGVWNSGTVTMRNSTVSGNYSGYANSGGGVLNSGTVILVRTIVSGNTADRGGPEISNVGGSTVIANRFNLFGTDGNAGVEGFTPGATDMVPTVPLSAILDPTLANNGGPTRTHALVPGSPAVDAVMESCPPPATDQRGVARPQGTKCDIGAFELEVQ